MEEAACARSVTDVGRLSGCGDPGEILVAQSRLVIITPYSTTYEIQHKECQNLTGFYLFQTPERDNGFINKILVFEIYFEQPRVVYCS